jgi:hypothetical protein
MISQRKIKQIDDDIEILIKQIDSRTNFTYFITKGIAYQNNIYLI